MIPKKVFFVKGVGIHKDKLTSFELALRSAGIEKYNIVCVSSIFPPRCKIINKGIGLKQLNPGQIIFCVMSKNETNEPNRLITSSIGLAVPYNTEQYGYLSEHHSFGEKKKTAGDYAEDLAATMLATALGISFDPDHAWDQRKQVYKTSGLIIKTRHICKSAKGNKYGLWTSVVAAAVFILD